MLFGLRRMAGGVVETARLDPRSRAGGEIVIMIVRTAKAVRSSLGKREGDAALVLRVAAVIHENPTAAPHLAKAAHLSQDEARELLIQVAVRAQTLAFVGAQASAVAR